MTDGDARTSADWPPLPTTGFISGRVATEDEFKSGQAVFCAKVGDELSGSPADMEIPQYAFHQEADGPRTPVVVLQAQDEPNGRIFGLLDAAGQIYVCTEAEVTLLGTSRPS